MTEQHDKSSAVRNPQANTQVADARTQVANRQANVTSSYRDPAGGMVPRLSGLCLVCVALLAIGVNRAAATDQVPYSDAYQLQNVRGVKPAGCPFHLTAWPSR